MAMKRSTGAALIGSGRNVGAYDELREGRMMRVYAMPNGTARVHLAHAQRVVEALVFRDAEECRLAPVFASPARPRLLKAGS